MKRLKLIVSVALLSGLAWRTDWAQVGEAFARLRPEFWLAGLGLYTLTQAISGLRWQLLARPLGFRQPLGHFVGFYFVGMFFNLVLPTSVGGDVIRALYLDGGTGRKLPALVSVLVDRGSGLMVLLALACGTTLVCPVPLPAWIEWSAWSAGAAALLGAASILLYCRYQGANGGMVEEQELRGIKQHVVVFQSAIRSLQSAIQKEPMLLLSTTALSLLVQAANVIIVWLVGLAIGAEVPGVWYWIAVPMVTLLTVLPVSMNGMGVREGGMVLFLAPLGVGEGTALSLAFLWFTVMTATSLLGGLVYLAGHFPRPEERGEHGPVGDHPDQGRVRELEAAA